MFYCRSDRICNKIKYILHVYKCFILLQHLFYLCVQNVRDIYVGNDPTSCLAELCGEHFPTAQQGTHQRRPLGCLRGGHPHTQPADGLSVLGNAVPTDTHLQLP